MRRPRSFINNLPDLARFQVVRHLLSNNPRNAAALAVTSRGARANLANETAYWSQMRSAILGVLYAFKASLQPGPMPRGFSRTRGGVKGTVSIGGAEYTVEMVAPQRWYEAQLTIKGLSNSNKAETTLHFNGMGELHRGTPWVFGPGTSSKFKRAANNFDKMGGIPRERWAVSW